MTTNRRNPASTQSIDRRRRDLLSAAGVGIATATLSGVFPGSAATAQAQTSNVLRWGVVGTGGIANSMAPRIVEANGAELAAVSSRRADSNSPHSLPHGVSSRDSRLTAKQSSLREALKGLPFSSYLDNRGKLPKCCQDEPGTGRERARNQAF